MSDLPVTEYYCRGCGWTEPEFQAGDPALCSGCSTEYEPSYVFEIPTEGTENQPPVRTRDWPRCGEWTTKDRRCERKVPSEGDTCHDHGDEPAAWEFEVVGPHNSPHDPNRYVWAEPPGKWRDDHEVQNVRKLVYGDGPDDPEAVGWEAEYWSNLHDEWTTEVFDVRVESEPGAVRNVKSLVPMEEDED